jgi:hypothetical protein
VILEVLAAGIMKRDGAELMERSWLWRLTVGVEWNGMQEASGGSQRILEEKIRRSRARERKKGGCREEKIRRT